MITRWADGGGWGGSIFNHVTRSRGCVCHVGWPGWRRFGGERGALLTVSRQLSSRLKSVGHQQMLERTGPVRRRR